MVNKSNPIMKHKNDNPKSMQKLTINLKQAKNIKDSCKEINPNWCTAWDKKNYLKKTAFGN